MHAIGTRGEEIPVLMRVRRACRRRPTLLLMSMRGATLARSAESVTPRGEIKLAIKRSGQQAHA